MKKQHLRLLSLIFFVSIACSQNKTKLLVEPTVSIFDKKRQKISKNGECYTKSLIPETYENITEEFVISTGNEIINSENLKTITIEIQPKSTEWVKLKALKNCEPTLQDDCLVWCLKERPAIIDTLLTVLDTNLTKNYKKIQITRKIKTKEGGSTDWVESICNDKVDKVLTLKIQEVLFQKGYYKGSVTTEISNETFNAIEKYQLDNNLPIGGFNFASLDLLGIEY